MKKLILTLFASSGPMDSFDVLQHLGGKYGLKLSIHAVQMALMRYWRQGLLQRKRRGGRYAYTLTEKGGRRLLWLRGLRS